MDLEMIGKQSKEASFIISNLGTSKKNEVLRACSEDLTANMDKILKANKIDLDNAVKNGIKGAFLERLTLNEERVLDMAKGLLDVSKLDDPIGDVLYMKTLENGLTVGQKRVPLGVLGIIFESRPNVTSDAFALSFKTGNAVILRGGKEAINSNIAIVEVFKSTLKNNDVPEFAVQIIEDTSHETAEKLMRLNKYVDVLIPRGGANLIQTVVNNSTIPVIETGVGNCHIYVDDSADFDMAVNIILNAKTQRPGVCNACESILVHKDIAKEFIPKVCTALQNKDVEIRGDNEFYNNHTNIVSATDEDFKKEFADLIISAKVVSNIEEAISHINDYGTKHSEAIITESYKNSQKFLNEVDAAAVYVNASTRFTDGSEFGFGAEIGISTQKLHARGPMGLKELTTTKYIIYGEGQVR